MNSNLQNYSHRRFNILTGEWILVSPHRAKRPWQGQEESTSTDNRPAYDKSCFLCAGNTRVNGKINPKYTDVFVFQNDFAALQEESSLFSYINGLLKAESEKGICKVVCFSPDHSKSLAQMSVENIERVVNIWQQEYINLGEIDYINYVQIFENKGAVMGCSNPHPHGQIWSQSTLPNEVVKKDLQQYLYYNKNNKTLLGDYIAQEIALKERVIFENEYFIIITPFWAVWPYEAMIIPKTHQTSIKDLSKNERLEFAEAISIITKVYDKLFNCSLPYSSGIHQAPTNGNKNEHWHWHMSFYPPLLRSATVKKFMVGYEMFGEPQRDITAETACKTIRSLISI